MKAIEQFFRVVLFSMLYKVVLTFKSVDETLVCDHSKESYWAVLSCGTVYYAVQGGSNFFKNLSIKPECIPLNKSYVSVHSCGYVHYRVQGNQILGFSNK